MIDLEGTWLVEDTHVDPSTGFLLTETSRVYGDLRDAFEGTLFHRNTQQVKISFYSPDDLTN